MAGYTHPAYTNPKLPTVAGRTALAEGTLGGSPPAEAVQRIYKLSIQEEIPLHFALGKDSLGAIRFGVDRIGKDIEKYADWSEGLDGMVGLRTQ